MTAHQQQHPRASTSTLPPFTHYRPQCSSSSSRPHAHRLDSPPPHPSHHLHHTASSQFYPIPFLESRTSKADLSAPSSSLRWLLPLPPPLSSSPCTIPLNYSSNSPSTPTFASHPLRSFALPQTSSLLVANVSNDSATRVGGGGRRREVDEEVWWEDC